MTGTPNTNDNWRRTETQLIDALHQMGVRFSDECGRPFIVAEYFDSETGQLIERQHIVDVQKLAELLTAAR